MDRGRNQRNWGRHVGAPPRWDINLMKHDLWLAHQEIYHLKGQVQHLVGQNHELHAEKEQFRHKARRGQLELKETISKYEAQVSSLSQSLQAQVDQQVSQVEHDKLAATLNEEKLNLSEQLRSREEEFLQAKKAWQDTYKTLQEKFGKELVGRDQRWETSDGQVEEENEVADKELTCETGVIPVEVEKEVADKELTCETGVIPVEVEKEEVADKELTCETGVIPVEVEKEEVADKELTCETGVIPVEVEKEEVANKELTCETGVIPVEEEKKEVADKEMTCETGVIPVEVDKAEVEEPCLSKKKTRRGFWSLFRWLKSGQTKVAEKRSKKEKEEKKKRNKEQKEKKEGKVSNGGCTQMEGEAAGRSAQTGQQ